MPKADINDDLKEATFPRLFDLQETENALKLAERFIIPPFTQLDARSGAWQERKRMWLDLGLRSEKGRTARTFAEGGGKDDVSQKILALTNGQSIFDPVLCELLYRWYCPREGLSFDPFAGGSVRGLVAAITGRHYVGVDLSDLQVQANMLQAKEFQSRSVYPDEFQPTWITGDSRSITAEPEEWGLPEWVDFIMSCPPYHDLEKYSADPLDLSNMSWPEFIAAYREIIEASCAILRPNRFAAFVVGEIRGPDGTYRNFVGETVRAFVSAGLDYYNEALLVNPAGTLPLRAAKQFVATRKLGRTHQSILIFVKGDPKLATEACMDRHMLEAAIKAMGRGETLDEVLADTDDEDLTPGWHN